jgi:hypothetical protein
MIEVATVKLDRPKWIAVSDGNPMRRDERVSKIRLQALHERGITTEDKPVIRLNRHDLPMLERKFADDRRDNVSVKAFGRKHRDAYVSKIGHIDGVFAGNGLSLSIAFDSPIPSDTLAGATFLLKIVAKGGARVAGIVIDFPEKYRAASNRDAHEAGRHDAEYLDLSAKLS